jgi:hypothetical protein
MLGVLVLVGALAVVFAGPASAYTHKQKRHIQRVLLHQLKKHPRLIKNKHWLRKADHVQEVLPLTIRLNPSLGAAGTAPSDDSALLDFSDTFGPEALSKPTTLDGVVHVDAHFGNPQDGDTLGSLRLVVRDINLTAASVGVLDNAQATATGPGGYGCTNLLASAPQWTFTQGGVGTLSGPAVPTVLAPSVDANTVVRTAPIGLSLANTAAPNVGSANLFTPSNNVRLSLHANAAVNTIFRVLDDGTGASGLLPPGTIPTGHFNCDEALAGQTVGDATHNVIPVNVAGTLKISPALTADGRLRIATVSVKTPTPLTPDGSEIGHSTVDACLQPYSLVDTPQARSDISAFESAVGSPPLPSPAPDPATLVSSSQPTTHCDATPFALNFPLAQLGEQEITPADAKFLHLDPNVQVTNLTGEALIGTY